MPYSFSVYFSNEDVEKAIKKFGSLKDFERVVKKKVKEMIK